MKFDFLSFYLCDSNCVYVLHTRQSIFDLLPSDVGWKRIINHNLQIIFRFDRNGLFSRGKGFDWSPSQFNFGLNPKGLETHFCLLVERVITVRENLVEPLIRARTDELVDCIADWSVENILDWVAIKPVLLCFWFDTLIKLLQPRNCEVSSPAVKVLDYLYWSMLFELDIVIVEPILLITLRRFLQQFLSNVMLHIHLDLKIT